MREIITTQISEELKFILVQYFDEHEIDIFIQNIMDDILILTSINSFDRGGETSSLASGSFFTSKIRSIADRIMTFASDKLEAKIYNSFLIEFGKLMISKGEMFLALEIFNNILKYSTDNKDSDSLKALAYINLAKIYLSQANWKDAALYLNEAKAIYEKAKDFKGLSQCEHLFGVIASLKGDLVSAKSIFENALKYLENQDENLLFGNIEINLGNIYAKSGEYDQALRYYNSCLKKFQDINDKRRVAEVRNNIGMVYIHTKEYEYALFEYDECIQIAGEGRYLPILGIAYVNKAVIYININELKLAAFYTAKALDIAYQVNNLISIAEIYKLKGIIAKKQYEFQLSEEYLKASLRLNKELNNELNFAESAYEIALLYYELNLVHSYELYFNKALEYYTKIKAEDKILKIKDFLK